MPIEFRFIWGGVEVNIEKHTAEIKAAVAHQKRLAIKYPVLSGTPVHTLERIEILQRQYAALHDEDRLEVPRECGRQLSICNDGPWMMLTRVNSPGKRKKSTGKRFREFVIIPLLESSSCGEWIRVPEVPTYGAIDYQAFLDDDEDDEEEDEEEGEAEEEEEEDEEEVIVRPKTKMRKQSPMPFVPGERSSSRKPTVIGSYYQGAVDEDDEEDDDEVELEVEVPKKKVGRPRGSVRMGRPPLRRRGSSRGGSRNRGGGSSRR